jgi:DNA replication initiation complex subunit (GINS family)
MEFMDEIMFVGLDIPKVTKNMLDEADEKICKNMTPDEKKVYDFGVKTVLSLLESILTSNQEDNEVFVHIPGQDIEEEFDYEDLSKLILGE